MKTIFITISRGSLIRNFFTTGVITHLLNKGFRIVLLVPDVPAVKKIITHEKYNNLYLEQLTEKSTVRFGSLFVECFRGAVFNSTVHIRYKYRISGDPPPLIFYPVRMIFFAPLCLIPGFKKFIRFLHAKLSPQIEHDYLFKKYKPDLVFSTAAGNYAPDNGVIKSAKRYGATTVAMGKSWDNLSKMLFVTKADYLIVWGDFMKRQAIRFQGYKENEIFITGAPQFDFYADKKWLVSREEFCKKFGFDPKKKIILYGSAGGNDCWDDPAYLRLIRSYIDEGKLKNVQILTRPHLGCRDDDKRFIEFETHPSFVVDREDTQTNIFKDRGDFYSERHVKHLVNSLYHADVCPNMVSTLTLDCLASGTPVLNMNFDTGESKDPQKSVKRLTRLDYAKAVLDFGWVWSVESEREFREALTHILEEGKSYREEKRKEMIEYFICKNDGKSAERLGETIATLTQLLEK